MNGTGAAFRMSPVIRIDPAAMQMINVERGYPSFGK